MVIRQCLGSEEHQRRCPEVQRFPYHPEVRYRYGRKDQGFTMEAISKKADASKEYKKKRIDNLEKINEKLDDIIRILRH